MYQYEDLIEEWVPKYADIMADLEYNKNLMDHLVTTELMINKVHQSIPLIENLTGELDKWHSLGYSILSTQHQILNTIPDFVSRQRTQLVALSREQIKTERFHNDAILRKDETLTNEAFLNELRTFVHLIDKVFISPEGDLQVALKSPITETIASTATYLARLVDSHGINLRQLVLFDANNVKVTSVLQGTPIFTKPLS